MMRNLGLVEVTTVPHAYCRCSASYCISKHSCNFLAPGRMCKLYKIFRIQVKYRFMNTMKLTYLYYKGY
jgi:hypothetical protein